MMQTVNTCTVCILENANFRWKVKLFTFGKRVQNIKNSS